MTCESIHDRRLTRKKAAEYIGYEPGTLEKWASKGINLRYHRVGGRIYYDISDLDEFLKGQQTF